MHAATPPQTIPYPKHCWLGSSPPRPACAMAFLFSVPRMRSVGWPRRESSMPRRSPCCSGKAAFMFRFPIGLRIQ